jgi:two-component system, cell cycle response regulator
MAEPNAQAADQSRVSAQICQVLWGLLAEQLPRLARHLEVVAHLADATVTQLGFTAVEREPLIRAAYLHDFGKLAVPERILAKPGPLDELEVKLIRQHTVVGARILTAVGVDPLTVSFLRSHHEWMDGSGYPDGLSGDEIPLGARVIAVCDAYEAMIAPRPYRPKPMKAEAACAELVRCAGTQFDETLVGAMTTTVLAARRQESDAGE